MKLERINEFVLVTTVVIIGVLLAVFCGRWAGSGDNQKLWIIAALAVVFFVCLLLRSRIWVLIPVTWSLTGQLNGMPGHFPAHDGFIVLAFVFYCTLKALKVVNTRPRFRWLDFLLVLNLLYVLFAYLRNPVGVNAVQIPGWVSNALTHLFGTTNIAATSLGKIGGKPYVEVIFAVLGYWVLSQVPMSPRLAFWLPAFQFCTALFIAILNVITTCFPFTAPIIGHIYSGISAEEYIREQTNGDAEATGREAFLQGFSGALTGTLCAYYSALTLAHPLSRYRNPYSVLWACGRCGILYWGLYLALKSGHRLTVPAIAFTIYFSLYLRRGLQGVLLLASLTVPPFCILIFMQGNLIELPQAAQRTLCFLPGKWSYEALSDAKSSTEWRYEMWDIVMHSDKYIKNKVLGDGFGYTLEAANQMQEQGSTTQENFMISGDVHSGPISAIRFVGYVGLCLFLILIIAMAIEGWRLALQAKGTPYFPLAITLATFLVYSPFGYCFVFGAYNNDLPTAIFYMGMINLLKNAMETERRKSQVLPPAPARPVPRAPLPRPELIPA